MKSDARAKQPQWLEHVHSIFQTLLVVYLVLLLANQFKPLVYPLYLNILLGVVLVLGAISVWTRPETATHEPAPRMRDYLLVWALGIIGSVLVFLKTGSLGWLRYVLTGLSGALIVLLGYVVYSPEQEEKPVYLSLTWQKVLIALVALLVVALALLPWLGFASFRIVFGAVFVLFVPGLSLSYAFFSETEIDVLERFALSFALSIAVVPILVFYLNLIGVKVSVFSVLFVVSFVTVLGYWIARRKHAISFFFKHKGWRTMKLW